MRGTLGLGPSPAPAYREPSRWWERAACAGDDLFQEEEANVGGDDLLAMRATCRACPVAAECLADTLRHRDQATFRSGWTAKQRGKARKKGVALTPGGPAPAKKKAPRRERPPAVDGTHAHERWTPEEDALVLAGTESLPVAQALGRTVWAVRNRRSRLRRAAQKEAAS